VTALAWVGGDLRRRSSTFASDASWQEVRGQNHALALSPGESFVPQVSGAAPPIAACTSPLNLRAIGIMNRASAIVATAVDPRVARALFCVVVRVYGEGST